MLKNNNVIAALCDMHDHVFHDLNIYIVKVFIGYLVTMGIEEKISWNVKGIVWTGDLKNENGKCICFIFRNYLKYFLILFIASRHCCTTYFILFEINNSIKIVKLNVFVLEMHLE